MKIKRQPTKLEKKAKRGFRGYPLATMAFYGPDATRASKVAVGIFLSEDGEVAEVRRWFSETMDVRWDKNIGEEILAFLKLNGVVTVTRTDGLLGCPHEEGIDYPEGSVCPACPYWANRDRFTGELLPVQ